MICKYYKAVNRKTGNAIYHNFDWFDDDESFRRWLKAESGNRLRMTESTRDEKAAFEDAQRRNPAAREW